MHDTRRSQKRTWWFWTFPFIMILNLASAESGFGLSVGHNGSGFYFQYIHSVNMRWDWGMETHFIDVTGENEFKLVDPYTGTPYTFNGQSLVLLPNYIGGRYYPFAGDIANNFSPFVTGKAGVVIVADGDESIARWSQRWSSPEISFAPSVLIGGGFQFYLPFRSNFSLTVGYQWIPLSRRVDGKRNYNGMILQMGFSR